MSLPSNVYPMRPKGEQAEDWLTKRKMAAYYVLGITRPELMSAGAEFALPRTAEVERIEAALHASENFDDPGYARARNYVVSVMRLDAEATAARIAKGGW